MISHTTTSPPPNFRCNSACSFPTTVRRSRWSSSSLHSATGTGDHVVAQRFLSIRSQQIKQDTSSLFRFLIRVHPCHPCPILRNTRSRRGAQAPTTASTSLVMHDIPGLETGQIMARIADHGQPCLRSYNDALCARKRPWMGISMPFPALVQLISTDINLPTATSATPLHELMTIIPHLPPFVKKVHGLQTF